MSLSCHMHHIKCTDLNDDQILSIVLLKESVWPELAETDSDTMRIKKFKEQNKTGEVILLEYGGQLAGHTTIFPRTIYSNQTPFEITALSGVCVAEKFRGKGFGKMMVTEVFRLVDEGLLKTCLFQTNIPAFYEKLGAKIIHNRFYNSQDPGDTNTSPWFEPYVMIYPKDTHWPEGNIDLNGPGY